MDSKQWFFGSLARFISLSFLQSIALPALCQWSVDPNINTPVSIGTGTRTSPVTASDGDGGVIIAWLDSRTGGNANIYAQRLDWQGYAQWLQNGIPLRAQNETQNGVRIVSDQAGGAILTWMDYRAGGTTIYAQRLNSSGSALWSADGVPVVSVASGITYDMVGDGFGGVYLTWQDDRYGNADIFLQRLNPDGLALWPSGGVPACTDTSAQTKPRIARTTSGGVVVTWIDQRHPRVFANSLTAGGFPEWGNDGVGVFDGDGNSVTGDGRGGAIVVSVSGGGGPGSSYTRLSAQRMDSSGIAQWGSNGATVDSIAPSYPISGADCISDGAGGAYVMCTVFLPPDLDNSNYTFASVFRMDNSGARVWGSSGGLFAAPPRGTLDGNGGIFFGFSDQPSSGMHISEIDRSGNTLVNGTVSRTPSDPNLAVVGSRSNGAIIVWRDWGTHSNGPGLYARYVAATSLTVTPGSLMFGGANVNSSGEDSVVVTNMGLNTVTITAIASNDAQEFSVVEGSPVIVPPHDSTHIHIVFHPVREGTANARILFTHTGPTSPDSVLVSGIGLWPDGFPETVTCNSTGGAGYTFPLSNVRISFGTLPYGGGDVTVRRYLESPPSPAYPDPPAGSTWIPLWYNITSPLENNSFDAAVTINVSGVTGFGPDSRVMYYNSTSNKWVLAGGSYNAGTLEFTFSTTHCTPFAFMNSQAPAYDVFVTKSPGVAAAGVVYPAVGWGGGYPGRTNDWGFTGAQPFSLYLVPQPGTTFGACELIVQYDSDAVALDSVSFTGSIFSGANLLFATSNRMGTTLTINASRVSPGNVTVGAGDYIAELKMKIKKPGHGTVALIGDNIVSFNAGSTPSRLLITPHQAEVKAYAGDVASVGDETTGDGKIDFQDLAAWSSSYWSGVPPNGMANYKSKYDIGPTRDGYVFSLPTYDGRIDFEDLMMFAISYGQSASHELPKFPVHSDETIIVSLANATNVGDEVRVPVMLGGGVTDVRAMKLEVGGMFGAFLGAEKGELLKSYETPVMVMSRADGHSVYVDLAVMGLDARGVNSRGEIVVLRFAGTISVGLAKAECRNSANRLLAVSQGNGIVGTQPATYSLSQNYPNPFNPSTTIRYGLPHSSHVSLLVYNALGQQVAQLVDEQEQAGYYEIKLENPGLASGVYFYCIHADDFVSTRKLLLLK